jgi:hypothetical protein
MDVPLRVRRNIGTQAIEKGSVAGELKFFAWDALPACKGEMCPAFMECTYQLKDKVSEICRQRENGTEIALPPCGLMHNYLASVTEIIFRNYAEDLNEAQLYRIGMGLLPQYRQLCRLQIEELGLGSVVYHNDKGDPKLHPLFNAIRDQIVAIEKMWHTIGLNDLDKIDIEKSTNMYDAMATEAEAGVAAKKEARILKER